MLINIVALDMLKSKLSPARDINRIRIPEFVSVFEPLRKSYWSDDQHNDTLLLDDLNYRKNRFDNIDREKFIKLDRDLNLKAQTSAEQNRYLKPLPKLPPRDRIKVGPNFHEFLETPRRSNQYYPDNAKSPNNNNETFNFGTLSKRNIEKEETTSRNRRKPSSSNEIESILRVNLPMKVSTIRLMSVSKTVIVRYESRKQVVYGKTSTSFRSDRFSKKLYQIVYAKTVDRKTSSSRAVAVSSRTLHKNDYNNLIHLNEDPYIRSEGKSDIRENEIASENVTNGTKKGLHWMSKSSTESSTDSDPYVSINDVYEPIYGYTSDNHIIRYDEDWR
ncbi:hypothetical protein SSS_03062 [Sarcoptes scabiei]|uniref:Uncharacterized protein n=1 Tax=Sarcoptes scabiei TaxID=52283 RepID=A0A834RHX7_SARSC|nr:hypothetical protein SSS_03062 [Sarcoptes scabiei]